MHVDYVHVVTCRDKTHRYVRPVLLVRHMLNTNHMANMDITKKSTLLMIVEIYNCIYFEHLLNFIIFQYKLSLATSRFVFLVQMRHHRILHREFDFHNGSNVMILQITRRLK